MQKLLNSIAKPQIHGQQNIEFFFFFKDFNEMSSGEIYTIIYSIFCVIGHRNSLEFRKCREINEV